MELAIFAKRAQSKDGKPFYKFLTTLHRKDGSAQVVAVKFADGAGTPRPEACPCNIVVEKGKCNMAARTYVDGNGELRESRTLWVSEWKPGAPYVDHSLDEYDF